MELRIPNPCGHSSAPAPVRPMPNRAPDRTTDIQGIRRRVLLVDDSPNFLELCAQILSPLYDLDCVRTPEEALERVERDSPDVVLADLAFDEVESSFDGFGLIREIRARRPELPVIVLSRTPDPRDVTRALDEGAFYFVSKHFNRDELERLVDRALRLSLLEQLVSRRNETHNGRRTASEAGGIVYKSEAMMQVMRRIERFAPSPLPVLVTGETGTGKDLVARRLHELSGRSGPYHAINVTALPDTLFEGEVFGHESGAFTGATKARAGLVELSTGGTLFIDEIGSLSLDRQAALLRVLEEGRVRRLGSERQRPVDVRFVLATNEDLPQRIAEGAFREDLWFRISKLHITLPPLRERESDAIHIAESFLATKGKRLMEDARAAIARRSWRGNVRELLSTLECALLYDEDDAIDLADLRASGMATLEATVVPVGGPGPLGNLPSEALLPYHEVRATIEREHQRRCVEYALSLAGNNVSRAAELCGVTRQSFYTWMRELGYVENEGRQAEA